MKKHLEIITFVLALMFLLIAAPIIAFGVMYIVGSALIAIWESGPVGIGALTIAAVVTAIVCVNRILTVLRKGLG